MEETWKGEGLIRGQKPKGNRKEATKLVNVIYHARRRKEGVPTAGAKKHSGMMKGVFAEVSKP